MYLMHCYCCRYEQHYGIEGARHYQRVAQIQDEGGPQRRILSVDEKNEVSEEPLRSLEDGLVVGSCIPPEYMVFTWILCLIALASALKLYYLVKTALALVIVTVYTVLIFVLCKDMFSEGEHNV